MLKLRRDMKASANLLWLGAAVTLSAFVSAYVVAMFVADRLTDCTTPAVLPVAYFIMLGYAVIAAQVGIMDMVNAGRPPPYVDELQWASFVVIGLGAFWVVLLYCVWLLLGFLILFFVPLGAGYLKVGMQVIDDVKRINE